MPIFLFLLLSVKLLVIHGGGGEDFYGLFFFLLEHRLCGNIFPLKCKSELML